MRKNLIIAFLLGALGAQMCQAQAVPSNITRDDLIEAAALCGILANTHVDPFGNLGMFKGWQQPGDIRRAAKQYAERIERPVTK